MIDIQFIRDNRELVAQKSKQKGYAVDITQLLGFDEERRKLLLEVEELRRQRNELASSHDGMSVSRSEFSPGRDPEHIVKGKQLKEKLADAEHRLAAIDKEFTELIWKIPNIFPDDTPIGDEDANREERKWGTTEQKSFDVVDHLTWGEQRGLIDFERGAKIAGAKFYFLKGLLSELDLAVFQLGLKLAKEHGFTAMTVPHLVNSRTLEGAGFSARGDEKQIYKIEGEDLNLIATAEIPLTGYHADEIIDHKDLPIMYAGISPAYRVEGGAYGKHNKGLFRTHQFNKLELYVYCKQEESEAIHAKLVDLEEDFCQYLEIPYRVVRIASGDLGAPAYKKFDVEYWSPVDKTYRELMSCSNVTDYQSRRLNIKYRKEDGSKDFVHTLNGTLAAMSRITIALIENHQTKNGDIEIPKALKPFLDE